MKKLKSVDDKHVEINDCGRKKGRKVGWKEELDALKGGYIAYCFDTRFTTLHYLHFYSVCYIKISILNLSHVGHLTYLSDVPLILDAIKSLIVEPIKRSARVSRG